MQGGGACGDVAARARRLRGMWDDGGPQARADAKADAKQHDAIFTELMQECKHSAPGARLSARLRTALERYAASSLPCFASQVFEQVRKRYSTFTSPRPTVDSHPRVSPISPH